MAGSGTEPSAVAPPAGTGFAPGLGEAFSIDLSTGQGGYSVPLPLPAGVAGHQPELRLEYRQGQANGPFGMGWRLPVRAIERRLDFGPDGQDRYMDGGSELLETGGGEFRARFEAAFHHYSRTGGGWRVEERGGIRHRLGTTPAARVADPDHPQRPITWLLERSEDPSGNAIDYTWEIDGGTPYLARVHYAIYTVRLVYEPRADVQRNGRAGFVRTMRRRCARVEVDVTTPAGERTIRSWTLSYGEAPLTGVSLLESVQLRSHGSSRPDVVRRPQRFRYALPEPETWHARFMESEPLGAPPPLTDPDARLAALDGHALPGVVQVRDGRFTYWPNAGDGRWGGPVRLRDTPIVASLAETGSQLLDLDGDTQVDLLVGTAGGAPPGYYANGEGDGWDGFVAYPRGRPGTPPFEGGRTRLADLDGDGRVDALYGGSGVYARWRNEGREGWTLAGAARLGDGEAAPDAFLGDPLVRTADMTGDGLPDLVRLRSGSVEYWPNLGNGRFGARVRMTAGPRFERGTAPEQIVLVDVDGDGCADVVTVGAGGVRVHFNRSGNGFAAPVEDPLVPPPIAGTVQAADLLGHGRPGLTWAAPRGRGTGQVLYAFGEAHPYDLIGAENGAGLESEIEYRSSAEDERRDRRAGERWTTFLPFPVHVVAGTRERDVLSGRVSETRYRYHEGHFDAVERRFEGFRRVDRLEIGDDARPDALTVHHYRIGEERAPGAGREASALNRMLHRVEVFAPDADLPLRVEEAEHEVQVLDELPDGRSRVWVTLTRSVQRHIEGTGDERVEERAYEYGPDGNVSAETWRAHGHRGGVSEAEQLVRTETVYAVHTNGRIRDKPADIVRRDAAGTLLAQVQRRYDGPGFTGRALGQLTRGLVTRELVWVGKAAAFAAHNGARTPASLGYVELPDADGDPAVFAPSERSAYDAAGVRVGERQPCGSLTVHTLDAAHLFRRTTATAVGTSRFDVDLEVGKAARVEAEDGAVTTLRYDAQGRLVAAILPGDTAALPTRTYAYDDAGLPHSVRVSYRLEHGAPATHDVTIYFDGGQRELQRRATVEPGRVVVSGHTVRTPWGDAAAEYEPTFEATLSYAPPPLAGRPARRIHYDALGRPVRTVDYSGGVCTVQIRPLEIVTTDAVGGVKAERLDVANRCVECRETGPGGAVARTTFEHTALGHLAAYGDDLGEVARHTLDARGEKLVIRHREAGTRRLVVDAQRRVVAVTNARGQTIEAAFDAADRIAELRVDGAASETYGYDDAPAGAVGRLREVRYPGGSQRMAYDVRGRLVRQEWSVDGHAQPYAIERTYNAQGLETGVTYPDGSVVERELTANGMTRRIAGFIDAVDYDARMLPVKVAFANGVTTTMTYTTGPGRVATQRTTRAGGAVLDDQAFSYDDLQRLLRIDDAGPGAVGQVDYSYDGLGQLAEMKDARGGGTTTLAYGYANGRSLASNGESDTLLHYDDPVVPGRLAGCTIGSGPRTAIGHDADGNVVSLAGRTCEFNTKGELVKVTRTDGTVARYGYDHRGSRVRKRVKAGALETDTVFLGDLAEIRNGQVTCFVTLGRQRLAVVSGGTVRWVHSDQLGSSTFFTDAAGTRIARIGYRPFGNAPGSAATTADQLFATHVWDAEAELYFMRRRYYDPALGRFLSPDGLYLHAPERALSDPRRLGLYTYVGNDPVNNIDPTGHSFWSVVGAIVGVVVGIIAAVALIAALAVGWWAVLLVIAAIAVVMVIGYVLAANADPNSAWGQFLRGFMIGMNAGLNAGLLVSMGPVGAFLGGFLGTMIFLGAVDEIANNEIYQGIMGWSNWLLPTSWLIVGLGVLFFLANVIPALVTLNQVDAVSIKGLVVDWKTGTIFTKGGWLSDVNTYDTAFNMGNFAFVDTKASSYHMEHEAGHTLNLAAFGSIFHLAGFVDEVILGNGGDAYSERLADSNDPAAPGERTTAGQTPIIPMWV